jgi:acetyl esterase/lipase
MGRSWLFLVSLLSVGCCFGSSRPALPFAAARAAHPTHLLAHEPSPQEYDGEVPREAEVVHYPSGDLQLMAWLAVPPGEATLPRPVLVYAHGGWSMEAGDFDNARAAYDAGFIVFMPTLRGENGNPGDHEFAFGEVDDLRASIMFVRQQPGVDASRIYLIGHSAGGMVTSLAALYPDLPVALTASIDGVYAPETVCGMTEFPTFDVNDPEECRLRSLLPFASELPREHRAYIGTEDVGIRQQMPSIQRAVARSHGRLVVVDVPGDHFQSVAPALADFLDVIRATPGG